MAKKKATKKTDTKKPVASKAGAKKSSGRDMLVVGSKTKEALKKSGCNVGGDVLEELNRLIHHVLEQAATRASANGRKTVRGHDIIA